MIASVTRLAVLQQTLLLDDAHHLASETGFVRRQRQLTGPIFAQTLVFSWLDQPDATLEVLAANAAELGADVCPQAIDNRLTPRAVAFFEALLCTGLDYAFQLDAAPPPLLGRFEGVYAFDTTHVSLPAALAFELPGHGGSAPADGAAACAIQVVLELSQGGVVEVQLGPGRTNDLSFELAHAALPAGALRLADRGFYDLGLFAAYTEAGVYWISRPQPLTQVSDEQRPGPAGRLWDYLRAQRGCQVDRWVWLGKVRLPARLIAVRVAPEEAERRRRKLRHRRRRKGEGPPSAASEGLCEWDVSVTNVPWEKASVEEVIGLRRLRWQIELLFKLFKSIGGVDVTAGRRRERVLVELYAKLLGQLLRGWVLLRLCGRVLEWSHWRASRLLQGRWREVSTAGDAVQLVLLLLRWQWRLRRCRKRARKRRPATFQFTLDPHDPRRANGSRFT
jgi:hypothetical protein